MEELKWHFLRHHIIILLKQPCGILHPLLLHYSEQYGGHLTWQSMIFMIFLQYEFFLSLQHLTKNLWYLWYFYNMIFSMIMKNWIVWGSLFFRDDELATEVAWVIVYLSALSEKATSLLVKSDVVRLLVGRLVASESLQMLIPVISFLPKLNFLCKII